MRPKPAAARWRPNCTLPLGLDTGKKLQTMNERALRSLLGRIVLCSLPLGAPLACGGAIEGEGMAGAGGDSTTGGASAGGAPGAGGSGGSACSVPPRSFCDLSTRTGTIPRSCVSGELTAVVCQSICGFTISSLCSRASEDANTVTIYCPPNCVAGRRPAGFTTEGAGDAGMSLGAHFARMSELESASGLAFRGLRSELRALGAPRRLLRALSRAARDEQRHTRATRALGQRFGAQPRSARVTPTSARSLEAIAAENVAEGCVRELYGALVATFQAQAARDLSIRSAMARIAHEETRHAALSLSLQRWLEQRLSPAALARVAAIKQRAVAELRSELEQQVPAPFAEEAGLPSRAESRRLFELLSCDGYALS